MSRCLWVWSINWAVWARNLPPQRVGPSLRSITGPLLSEAHNWSSFPESLALEHSRGPAEDHTVGGWGHHHLLSLIPVAVVDDACRSISMCQVVPSGPKPTVEQEHFDTACMQRAYKGRMRVSQGGSGGSMATVYWQLRVGVWSI